MNNSLIVGRQISELSQAIRQRQWSPFRRSDIERAEEKAGIEIIRTYGDGIVEGLRTEGKHLVKAREAEAVKEKSIRCSLATVAVLDAANQVNNRICNIGATCLPDIRELFQLAKEINLQISSNAMQKIMQISAAGNRSGMANESIVDAEFQDLR